MGPPQDAVLVVQNDTPSVVGSGLDELLRHVRTLKPDGVQLIITILHRLCKLGGEPVDAVTSCVRLCMPLCNPGGCWRLSVCHSSLLYPRAWAVKAFLISKTATLKGVRLPGFILSAISTVLPQAHLWRRAAVRLPRWTPAMSQQRLRLSPASQMR